ISDVEGEFPIFGRLSIRPEIHCACGDGITGRIIVDGNEIWSQHIEPGDFLGVEFLINVSLNIGSTVDFAVDPCSVTGHCTETGSGGCDETRFTAVIGTDPAAPGAGGMVSEEGNIIMTNSVFWGNAPQQIIGSATATYCNIQGGWPGDGNIDVDPNLTPDGHLTSGSACIDAGDLDPKLMGHYEFEGDASDSSGHGNHGTFAGDAQTVSDPEKGLVLSLDGNGDYVYIGDLDLISAFTLAFWMKPYSLPDSLHSTVMKPWDFGCEFFGEEFYGYAGRGDDDWWVTISTTTSGTGEWYHVALTYDGSLLTLYIDGNSVASDSASHLSNDEPLIIGSWYGTGDYFDGLIDDVRLYDLALGAGDIPLVFLGADIDGEGRVIDANVDIGADEFLDTDGDGLPDWWELEYFGDPCAADPNADPDVDDINNLEEYELYSSHPNVPPLHVPGEFTYIQDAIDFAEDGDTVLVAPGTYTGPNNVDLDFTGGSIVLLGPNGPAETKIDCEYSGRGFDFHSGETPGAAVIGFTIMNGEADYGGGIRCEASAPQIRNCIITDCNASEEGGGIYCYASMPVLADLIISDCSPDGIWMKYGGAKIVGGVELVSNDVVADGVMLTGDGILGIESDVTLSLDDTRVRCHVFGPGTIQVSVGRELTFEHRAMIDLLNKPDSNANGQILCNGLLRLTDETTIFDARVYVSRASFEDEAIVLNSVINAEAGAPYGQFFIEDSVIVDINTIESNGDRYLDLDPTEYDVNNIRIDFINVDINEGVGGTHGGLFELRGTAGLVDINYCDPNNEFFCEAKSVPAFEPNNWTINQMELMEEAKLNLTNRFDFQYPYDSGGDYEVLYVKHLILGPDSVLNTAFNYLYYETLDKDPTARIVNVPLLGFSLNNITFDDKNDYLTRVKHNNSYAADDYRIHVERVTNEGPDPAGMMRMTNLERGITYVNARAKAFFAKSSEEEILILFEYLFCDPNGSGELVIYLSDVPELLDHSDPLRSEHYTEVARLGHPPVGRPGSAGSGRFGVFKMEVPAGNLNFVRGTRVEFELTGP
ncbi:MAG: LamG domain-containing protein, partial [Planctomycetota bacterium]